jgi:hypothetical protein
MMTEPVVRVKDGVQFTTIAPGGFRILAALDRACLQISHDLTITSACDGEHSGPDDPHHRGEAYDVRTHDLPDKETALRSIQFFLGPRFYAFLEDPGTENEHIHAQVAKGTVYP